MPLTPGYGETPLLDDEFSSLLPHVGEAFHSPLCGDIWVWAGKWRRHEVNISVAPERIAVELPTPPFGPRQRQTARLAAVSNAERCGMTVTVLQLFGVRIEILPHAWQHSITDDEMRAVISYPLLRYAIITPYPDADSYMFVGRVGEEPWIEVAAEDEDEDGQAWAVFHSMLLTERTAKDIYEISGAAIDLRGRVVRQRPFIGPQYGKEN